MNTDHTVQMSDAFIVNDHIVTESRFQFERRTRNHYPGLDGSRDQRAGRFQAAAATLASRAANHYTRIEFQNMTTMSHGAHAIKFGTRMRDSRDATYTNGGFNGSFTFADTVNGAVDDLRLPEVHGNGQRADGKYGRFQTLVGAPYTTPASTAGPPSCAQLIQTASSRARLRHTRGLSGDDRTSASLSASRRRGSPHGTRVQTRRIENGPLVANCMRAPTRGLKRRTCEARWPLHVLLVG